MSTGKLRLGFVGAGRRARDHMKVARGLEDVLLVAACDVDEGRVREVSSEYGVKPYRELDEMLAKEKLDAVVISTPVPLHVPQAIKCVNAGLDVLLEKPISLDVVELNSLLSEVRRTGRLVVVGFQSRYSDLVRELKGGLDAGTLSMVAGYWYWTVPPIPWIRSRSQAGGQVVEQVVHLIDLSRFFAGEVESVYAAYTERGRDAKEDREVGFDNWASYSVTMRFSNGVVGSIHSTYALYPELFREVPSILLDLVSRETLTRITGLREAKVYRRNREVQVLSAKVDSMVQMYREFANAVLTGDKGSIPTRLEDAYWSSAVTLAANESAATGEVINVREFASRR